jgi:hypothetical protein
VLNFGAAEAAEAALKLETLGADGTLGDASSQLPVLEGALERLMADLARLMPVAAP